jgi:hypothetical protein
MLRLLKTSAYFPTGHYACKNKQVQLQSHAIFKFATSVVVESSWRSLTVATFMVDKN